MLPPKKTLSLKARAVAHLSRREYSESELQHKLKAHATTDEELQNVIHELKQAGWLSDERFAQAFVRQRQNKKGAALVLQELKQHNIDQELYAQLKEELGATEFTRALAIWEKKFKSLPASPQEKMKQMRFLASRGFSIDIIKQVFLQIQSRED